MGLGVRPGAHPQNGGSAFYTPGVVSAEYIFIRGHTYSNFFPYVSMLSIGGDLTT